jgi:hypothetical protein
MDIALYLRVLWRFRFLVVIGITLALALAFLSYMRVSFKDGSVSFSYRESETWEDSGVLFVTQPGFPWGRSVIQDPEPVGPTVTLVKPPRFGDTERFGSLAALYSALATGDPVQRNMLRSGPINGTIGAAPVLASELVRPELRSQFRTNGSLPLVRVFATADTAQGATGLTTRQIDAFRTYLENAQHASGIPTRKRVLVTVLDEPGEPEVTEGRSKLYPALIFVGFTALTLLLVFILENLRPQARSATAEEPRLSSVAGTSRRSA